MAPPFWTKGVAMTHMAHPAAASVRAENLQPWNAYRV